MKLFLSISFLLFISAASMGQDIAAGQVPAGVIKTFKTKYPAATSIQWELKKDASYKASFTNGGLSVKAYFLKNGNWDKTETKLETLQLPLVLIGIVQSDYPNYTLNKAYQHDFSDKASYYELKFENDTNKLTVTYTLSGSLLSKSEKVKQKNN